jgi:hypothetical protein
MNHCARGGGDCKGTSNLHFAASHFVSIMLMSLLFFKSLLFVQTWNTLVLNNCLKPKIFLHQVRMHWEVKCSLFVNFIHIPNFCTPCLTRWWGYISLIKIKYKFMQRFSVSNPCPQTIGDFNPDLLSSFTDRQTDITSSVCIQSVQKFHLNTKEF